MKPSTTLRCSKVCRTRDIAQIPGAGAAGGLGAGFLAFTDAHMQAGVKIVTKATGLQEKARDCDYCFTGRAALILKPDSVKLRWVLCGQ